MVVLVSLKCLIKCCINNINFIYWAAAISKPNTVWKPRCNGIYKQHTVTTVLSIEIFSRIFFKIWSKKKKITDRYTDNGIR